MDFTEKQFEFPTDEGREKQINGAGDDRRLFELFVFRVTAMLIWIVRRWTQFLVFEFVFLAGYEEEEISLGVILLQAKFM